MANYSASINIFGKTNLPATTKKINESFKRIGKNAESAQSALLKNSEAINRMGAAANRAKIALLGMAAVGIGSTLKFGMDYQDALQDLSSITGIVGNDLKAFGDVALSTSKEFGITSSAYLEAVKVIGSAKPELLAQPKMLQEVTRQSIILAKAQRLDLRTAAMATTTALNQFGKSGEDAAEVVNLLAAGSKLGSSEVGDISAAFINVGGSASAFGLSLNETNAALQTMAKKGELGAIAGTRLKSALVQMAKLSDEFNPAVVGLGTALHNLKDAGAGGANAIEVFGAEGVNAGVALMEFIDVYDNLLETTKDTQIAQEQAAKNMATFREAMKRLSVTIQNQLIPIFLKYEPALSAAAEKLGLLLGNTDKMKRMMKIAGVALFGITSAIIAMTAAQIALNIAMIASPVGITIMAIAAAVAAVGAAIGAIVIYWDELKDLMGGNPFAKWASYLIPIWGPIKAIIDGIKLIQKFRNGGAEKRPKVGKEADQYLKQLPDGRWVSKDVAATEQSKVEAVKNQTQLDVNMKIDQDGRARVTDAKSDGNLNFNSQMGLMIPSY